jgi:hypothetical protein
MQTEGYKSTWRNKSTQQTLSQIQRKDDKRHHEAAIRRQEKPYLPFHPANPYDSRVSAQHMPGIRQNNSLLAGMSQSNAISVTSSHDGQSMSTADAQHMPPPPLSQASNSTVQRNSSTKRHRPQGSLSSLQEAESRVIVLRDKLKEAKRLKELRLEEEALQQELLALEEA